MYWISNIDSCIQSLSFLYDLKVKCKMRGKGIGKQLIKASYQYAIANGYAGLYTVWSGQQF